MAESIDKKQLQDITTEVTKAYNATSKLQKEISIQTVRTSKVAEQLSYKIDKLTILFRAMAENLSIEHYQKINVILMKFVDYLM